ncbi:hypothetical protein I79_015131 [Cricetulus griseus]|uniref:Uncharacterized protein n=1 Tax=Cricetulus griseus TaxID=10029 RepID=G3HVY5_CRIGR|nr:hypothetical protein I79_015131 [Cricetulus griseus]
MDLCNFYINTLELDAPNAKKHRNMFTYLQKHGCAPEGWLPFVGRDSSRDTLESGSSAEGYARSLLAIQNDDVLNAHTHRPTGAHTDLCSAYLAFQRKEIEIH